MPVYLCVCRLLEINSGIISQQRPAAITLLANVKRRPRRGGPFVCYRFSMELYWIIVFIITQKLCVLINKYKNTRRFLWL